MILCRQITLFILLANVSFHAFGEWTPHLESSSPLDWSHPTDSYRINIDQSLTDDRLQNFSLEVDNIDVTATIEVSNDFATFRPPQPLAPGLHSFRLVEYLIDGDIVELGYWEIEVRSSSLYQEASTNVQGSLSGYRGIADDLPDDESADSFEADGSLVVDATISDKAWALAANADFLLNSQAFEPASDRKIELGEYLVNGQKGIFQANMGNQNVGSDSLMMQNFRRRGLSASADFSNMNSRLSGFALNTQQTTTFDDFLGFDDSDNRVKGLLLEAQPFTDNPEYLYMSAGYISGKGSTDGIATGSLSPASEGSTIGIVADSYLFSSQLRIRAELADSKSDFDGSGALQEVSDDAHHLLIKYSPKQWVTDSSSVDIGLEKKRVGTFFKSLANPGLPSDKELTRAFTNTTWQQFSVDASFAREEDNVADLDTIPTVKSNVTDISINYSPDWDISFLGNSSYSVAFNQTRKREKDRSAAVVAAPTNNEVASITVSANFAYTDWNWLLTYGSGNNEDFTDVDIDTEQDFAELVFNFPVGSRLYFSPGARREEIKDTDNSVTLTNVLFNLGVNAIIVQDKLTATLNASLNQSDATDDTTDRNDTVVAVQSVWSIQQQRGHIPALDAFITANYSKTDDKLNPQLNAEFYQVFLGLTLTYQ